MHGILEKCIINRPRKTSLSAQGERMRNLPNGKEDGFHQKKKKVISLSGLSETSSLLCWKWFYSCWEKSEKNSEAAVQKDSLRGSRGESLEKIE